MIMPDPCNGLDYQTVFQIVATFEGFSIWKGRRMFRMDAFSDIGGARPIFDDAEWNSSCERLKNSKQKIRDAFSMLLQLTQHGLRDIAYRAWYAILSFLWFLVRWAHKILVVFLRSTPTRARVSSAIPGGSALSGWPVERASAGG